MAKVSSRFNTVIRGRGLADFPLLIRPTSSNAVYGPPLTISATANTNPGRSNIDSAFLGQGYLELPKECLSRLQLIDSIHFLEL